MLKWIDFLGGFWGRKDFTGKGRRAGRSKRGGTCYCTRASDVRSAAHKMKSQGFARPWQGGVRWGRRRLQSSEA